MILTAALLAQSTIPPKPSKPDYRHQIGNTPNFVRGFIVEKTQTGGDRVHVNNLMDLGVITIPIVSAEWTLTVAPGPCVYTQGKLTFIAGTHFKTSTVLQTPDALYFCVPAGDGKGFRWMRVRGETSW